MGGKTSTSTSSVSIPPEVLARYNAVNARAEQVAQQPFQQYGGQFVAPLTPTQQAGLQGTSQAAGIAQPYYGGATGLALAGAMPVNPQQLQTARYMSPFTQAVAEPTYQALRQQQGQELAQQQANAIRSGAAFGERSGLERANLMRQQGLGTAQALAPIFQQGYQQALGTAQQQQGVNLAAEQANRQAMQQAATQIAGLGTGAQQAALQGAAAQMQAGAQEQQTQQADLTARYQQFLQERGYPFQVAQFLANIAMGTGALSGSTTTTTQPAGFFSDEREKTNIKPLGKGLYAYDYKDDVERARKTGEPMPPKRVGPMAQDIEKKAPGLVVDVDDYKVVRNPDSMGGSVYEPGEFERGGYAFGGGPYGAELDPLGQYKLMTAQTPGPQQQSGLAQAVSTGKGLADFYKFGKSGLLGSAATKDEGESKGLIGAGGTTDKKGYLSNIFKFDDKAAHGGLIIGRDHYDGGGDVDFSDDNDPNEDRARVPKSGFPSDVLASGSKVANLATAGGRGGPGGGQPSGLSNLATGISAAKGLGDLFGEEGMLSGVGDFFGSFFAQGGLVPRHGYQDGGDPEAGLVPPADVPEDYDTKLAKTMQAIKRIESGGDPRALGPATRTGDRAHGLYQVMGANIPSWTEAALGKRMTPEEFLADEKAQEETAKHRMGLYLKQYNDPAQVASMWFSGRPIEKAGEAADVTGTTVPRYISMFNKYYGGAEGPDLPARGAQEAQYREEPKEGGLSLKGVGDTVTSDRFLVPFLSFVGSTLASQRPTLGGALGEGIVGGVSGYQQNRQIQAQLAKGALDIIKERFTRSVDENNNPVWYDKYTGKKASGDLVENTYAGLLKARGIDPAEYGLSAGQSAGAIPAIKAPPPPTAPGAVTAAGAPAPAPAGAKTETAAEPAKAQGDKAWMNLPPDQVNLAGKGQKQVEEYIERNADYYGLTDERNPAKMRADIATDMKKARALSATGDAEQMREAQSLRQIAEEKQKRLDGYIRDAASLQVGKNAELAKAETQSITKYEEDAGKRLAAYTTARANLQRLADIYSRYEPGRPAPFKAELSSWFRGMGLPVPDSLARATPNYDEAMKIAMRQAFDIVGENNLSRAPKASLMEAIQTVPAPSLDPGATYSLLGRTIGEMDYLVNKDRAWEKEGRNMRPNQFLLKYMDENPRAVEEATRKAFSQIPVGKNVPPSHVEDLRKQYGNFTPAGTASTAPARQETPAQAPAAPTVGSVMRGSDNQNYRFKGGNPASPSSWEKVQ